MNDKTELLFIFAAVIILMIFIVTLKLNGDMAQILREIREIKEILP